LSVSESSLSWSVLFIGQSVRLGRVYLTRSIVFVVGEAVLGR